MNKKKYLEKLETLLNESYYDAEYIEKCKSYSEHLLANDLPVIFDVIHFSRLIGTSVDFIYKLVFSPESFYRVVCIPKKNGEKRVLKIPSLELKYIQRWILDNILSKIKISEFATGFCINRSIIDNAKNHLNKDCVINIDIKDFFPSTSFERVFRVFAYYGYTKEVSFFLAKLCTYEDELPQGSPASPMLSNIVNLKLDARLSALANTYNATYSRYADDLTFSGNCGIKKIVVLSEKIIKEEGYEINNRKTRISYKHQRQEVTGIIVNGDKLRVNKKYKRELNQEIYYCTKFGVKHHTEKTNNTKAFYKEHLYGKAYFVKMVEPEIGNAMLDKLNCIDWDY